MMKIRIENKYDAERTIVPFFTEVPNQVARFAMELIDKHANVAGQEDGEDSQGRAKLRLQKVDELVTRSFDIAERAFAMTRERGHMVNLPDLNEINADFDAERVAKLQEKKARNDAVAASKVA